MKTLPDGVLPPLVTPFKRERFDHAAFASNIAALNETDLVGYVVLGSNGEGIYLSDDEVVEVVEAAAEKRSKDKALLVGTGRESTAATIELTRRVAEAGADAALIVPPSYYRPSMTESALEFHYRSVADESKIPIVLYYVPKFAPAKVSAKLVTNLASHPNIIGMKDTSGDMVFLGQVLRERPADFKVYIGSASQLLAGLALGADGGILALANLMPEACIQLLRAVKSGDLEAARKLQYRVLPVNQAVTARFGIAGLKQALDLIGMHGGEPRRPLEPLSQKQIGELTKALTDGRVLVSETK